MIFFDFEVFKDDWLVVAIDPVERTEFVIVNNKISLHKLYSRYKKDIWCGYNCRGYDQFIFKAILLGFNPKQVNDWIIVKKKKGWEFSSLFNTIPLNIYDTMPNPPIGLKTLEGFMGYNIHETSVPFDIDRKLTPKEIDETIKYCRYDVLNSIDIFIRRKSEFDAHMGLVKTFGLPLSNIGKTQAQLAAIILGAKKKRFNDTWKIRLPDNVQLGKYNHVADWFLNPANHNEDAKLETMICGLLHTIAWGGIHAGVSKEQVKCAPDEVIFDVDVNQLYPSLMIEYGLLSRAVEKPEKFNHILNESLRLKAEGKKIEREPYKRICNIAYGGMGDKFNPLYDPLHRSLVCVYGQVFLVDLLDKVEDIIELLNSNTDGVFVKVKKHNVDEFKRRVAEWEARTRLKMAYDGFDSYWGKDVNNYVAVRSDGSYHSKGAYVKELSDLDYDLPIVNEALKNYILYGIRVEDTVCGCDDLRKFQKIVKLSNKYEWVEHEFGRLNQKFDNKAYRVFASTDTRDGRLLKCKRLEDRDKKDKFGNTPDHCFIENGDIREMSIPRKLDRAWYINLTYKRLGDFGL